MQKSFQMQIIFYVFPSIGLHCKLVPVQYGLLHEVFSIMTYDVSLPDLFFADSYDL